MSWSQPGAYPSVVGHVINFAQDEFENDVLPILDADGHMTNCTESNLQKESNWLTAGPIQVQLVFFFFYTLRCIIGPFIGDTICRCWADTSLHNGCSLVPPGNVYQNSCLSVSKRFPHRERSAR